LSLAKFIESNKSNTIGDWSYKLPIPFQGGRNFGLGLSFSYFGIAIFG